MTAFLLCSWCLEVNVSVIQWELQTLDIPPSHIPYFTRSNKQEQEFCEEGDCQVHVSKWVNWSL